MFFIEAHRFCHNNRCCTRDRNEADLQILFLDTACLFLSQSLSRIEREDRIENGIGSPHPNIAKKFAPPNIASEYSRSYCPFYRLINNDFRGAPLGSARSVPTACLLLRLQILQLNDILRSYHLHPTLLLGNFVRQKVF